jgi:hypothetical protein
VTVAGSLARVLGIGYDVPTPTDIGDTVTYQFDANESRLAATMAAGHMTRKGHQLRGVWVYEMPGFRKLQRTCCKEGRA